MKQDTTSSFESRLEQWISKQGLLFLITHGRSGGSLFSKLIGILFKLIILALICLVIVWFYLKKRPESESFKEDLIQQISQGMNADNVKIKSITRVNGGILSGDMYIKSLKLGETEASFFKDWRISEYKVNADGSRTDVEIDDVASFNGVTVSPLQIGDNYFTNWSANRLTINSMELSLKTGGDTDEQALTTYSSLFREYDSLKINTISVNKGTVYWGSSTRTKGTIKNARFDILRNKDSWEMNISGGTFSYAWLQDAKIINMKLTCNIAGEVKIQKAKLVFGGGELEFNVNLNVAAKPRVKGDYNFKKVSVLDFIGRKYDPWFDGQIKGSGTFIGKLNSAEGITYDTIVNLEADPRVVDEDDSAIIINGNQFKILAAIQSIDQYNIYSKLRAYKGVVKFKYQELAGISDVTLDDVSCGLDDLIRMNGSFKCTENNEIPVSLEEAKSQGKQFSGEIKMGLLPKAFQSNVEIIEAFKLDDVVYRTQFDVDIEGQIHQLTSKAGEKLEEVVRKIKNNR